MFPILNWREIAQLAAQFGPSLVGAHLERVLIADRPDFPQGYLKNEWILRFQDRKREHCLWLSLRPKACFFSLIDGKGPKPSTIATRSPFDQALTKAIKGRRITAIRAIDRERMVVLEFGAEYWLILVLIPALPEAVLVEAQSLKIVARSRSVQGPSVWQWPDQGRVPPQLEVRPELVSSAGAWNRHLGAALEQEAFTQRSERALRLLREREKFLKGRRDQSSSELDRAEAEPDWAAQGEALKAEPDVENLGAELEKLFAKARRKKRRLEEAGNRLKEAEHQIAAIHAGIQKFLAAGSGAAESGADASGSSWKAIQEMELLAGVGGASQEKSPVTSKWAGRKYVSRDGLSILVGRTRDENLELTFKLARGNDFWLHVRGKPGAHVLIPVSSGKSAPLETLLDAAQLAVFFSGGKAWGKTEVDYTQKKYVKRIKGSTEASYTQNKTLIVAPEQGRLDRLLSQEQQK